MQSKTEFIKKMLGERGIFDYTEEDLKILKKEMLEAIHFSRDKYQAFEDAFIFGRGGKHAKNKKI